MKNVPNEMLIGSPSEVLQRAAIHYNKSEFAAAAAICREVIEKDADNADALYILGHIAMQTGESDVAVGNFVRAVSLDPTEPRFNRGFAEALGRSGRTEQAISAWSQYLTLQPNDLNAHCSLGQLLVASSRSEAAIDIYKAAALLDPDDTRVQLGLAIAYHKAGHLTEAIPLYEKLLLENEEWTACHNGLAAALRHVGENNRAITHGKRAIQLAPNLADAHNNLGLSYIDAGDTARALNALQEANRLQPENAEIINNLGVALAKANQVAAAQEQFHKALAARPGWAEGHLNLANAYRRENRLGEAVENYQRAIEADPSDFRIYGSFALAQLNQNQPKAAIANYEIALELAPSDPELRKGLGIAQLLAGNLSDGWQNYESRLQCGQPRQFSIPRWNGEDLESGTLLVHAEQGFGDTLQFCRYLAPLSQRVNAAKIVFECQKSLVGLLETIEGADAVVPRGAIDPAADRHVPLMSLPRIFSTTLETIPAPPSYLTPPTSGKVMELPSGKPNIGIVWRGNPLRQDDNMRSCPLSALAPLFRVPGLNFISLQTDVSPEDRKQLKSLNVHDVSENIDDFGDTASIVSQLDLIVSVDTATAHLCGGLGKPIWVLLEYAADWRYLLGRDDSPWYPSMKLFRQQNRGDWDGLAACAAAALAEKYNF